MYTKLNGITSGATRTLNSATNGNITVNGVESIVYAHPTGAGNNHIPTGGAANNFLKYSASGVAVWATPTLAGLAETSITSPTTAQVLRYNGTSWVNASLTFDDIGNGTGTGALVTNLNADMLDSKHASDFVLAADGRMTGALKRTYNPSSAGNKFMNIQSMNLTGTTVGTIKITLPTTWNSTMMNIKLIGYDYNRGNAWELMLGGYNYIGNPTPGWLATNAISTGTPPFTSIRFGHDGTKCCILLGTVATSWNIQSIEISSLTTTFVGYNYAFETGWTMGVITDETGITVTGTPVLNAGTNVDTVDGFHMNQDVRIGASPSFTAVAATGLTVSNPANTLATMSMNYFATTNVFRLRIGGAGAGSVAPFEIQASGDIPMMSLSNAGDLTIPRQFKSTIATGTAPLVVTSSTMVPNLNANYVGGIPAATLLQGRIARTVNFTVGGDANTYYPVKLFGSSRYGFSEYSVTRGYSDSAPDTWNTATHKGGLTLTFNWSGDTGYGGNDKAIRVIQFNETYTTMVAGLVLTASGLIVWLRGGGAIYNYQSESGLSATTEVYLTGYTAADSNVYAPRTNVSSVASEIYSRFPVRGTGALFVGTSPVWHTGNMGTGSGMNADSVDGFHLNQDVRDYATPTFNGIISTKNHSFVSKYFGYKSWNLHHPDTDAFVIVPSWSINDVDWDWGNSFTFHEDGQFDTYTLRARAEDGISPMSIDSKTLVANLNADLLDGKHASYNDNDSIVIRDSEGNIYGTLNTKESILTGGATGAAWYRIAASPINIGKNSARFEIRYTGTASGIIAFEASIEYGTNPNINQITSSVSGGVANGFKKARIVYNTTSSGNYAYLEIYKVGQSVNFTAQMTNPVGWSILVAANIGSIPSGYTSLEYTFVDGMGSTGIISGTSFKSTVATGTAPLTVTSSTMVTNFNANFVGGYAIAFDSSINTIAMRNGSGNISAVQFVSTAATGVAPLVIASTTMVVNLNSNLVGGFASSQTSVASTIPVRTSSKKIAEVAANRVVTEERLISTTQSDLVTYMTLAEGIHTIKLYLSVVNTYADINIKIIYTAFEGIKTIDVVSDRYYVDNYYLVPIMVRAKYGTNIIVRATSSSSDSYLTTIITEE